MPGIATNVDKLLEVAKEMCDLPEDELIKALDPAKMTQGGLVE